MLSRVPRCTRLRLSQRAPRTFCSSSSKQGAQEHSSSKEIGNPITWANPNNGPSQDANTSNAWKWVYPIGFGLILAASLVSRKRNKDKKEAEGESADSDKHRSARMHQAMERLDFVTKSPAKQQDVSDEYEQR